MVEDEYLIDLVVRGIHRLEATPLLINAAYLLADLHGVLLHHVEVVGLRGEVLVLRYEVVEEVAQEGGNILFQGLLLEDVLASHIGGQRIFLIDELGGKAIKDLGDDE